MVLFPVFVKREQDELYPLIGEKIMHVSVKRKEKPGVFSVLVPFQKPEREKITFVRVVFPGGTEIGEEPEVASGASLAVYGKRPDDIRCKTSVRLGFHAPYRAECFHGTAVRFAIGFKQRTENPQVILFSCHRVVRFIDQQRRQIECDAGLWQQTIPHLRSRCRFCCGGGKRNSHKQ